MIRTKEIVYSELKTTAYRLIISTICWLLTKSDIGTLLVMYSIVLTMTLITLIFRLHGFGLRIFDFKKTHEGGTDITSYYYNISVNVKESHGDDKLVTYEALMYRGINESHPIMELYRKGMFVYLFDDDFEFREDTDMWSRMLYLKLSKIILNETIEEEGEII